MISFPLPVPVGSLAWFPCLPLPVPGSLQKVVRCCCDRAICECYVCLEDMPKPDSFSLTTAIVVAGVLLVAGTLCLLALGGI
jgi:hypothetical protein